jgi:hypothetical protein
MTEDPERISMDRVVEVLFNDSSKNFSDLKSRQWTVTNLSVVAIMALAALAHGNHDNISLQPAAATAFMFVIVLGHGVVFDKCNKNLRVFRKRLVSLARDRFSRESEELFREGGGFESVVVDEGRVTTILFASPLFTFLCGLVVVRLPH